MYENGLNFGVSSNVCMGGTIQTNFAINRASTLL